MVCLASSIKPQASPCSDLLLAPQDRPRWDADARRTHSQACTGKSRLSAQEKLDIVCMFYSAPASTRCRRTVHQWDIAKAYGKSRAAISKVLKPEYALGVMKTAEGLQMKGRTMVLRAIREESKKKKMQRQHQQQKQKGDTHEKARQKRT
ncbi:hypothetical protein GUITHDRAFT_120056 [Guillardia theta CCMP2712]|uniref:Uncharacterized protein n=1 Tax=Guillardia theta (strain CCMP2712) TaxID=905079 RepID=L1IBV2_GUITC|nr:hypothetical protein GUITHDRAFT_120056 [Guillardia theta CCMP2712]EKX33726.1 hypothetical protein GUITHDRAFT_120056 [Guillardia theta CCMP2712]|eukprot:XP_005820706.1 hypothetical protein GUITHDRAFT_120056 [Guillardia theta CCMP2712]